MAKSSAIHGVTIHIGDKVGDGSHATVTLNGKNPGMFITGDPNTGKSVFINQMVASLLKTYDLTEMELFMLDMKDMEWGRSGIMGATIDQIPQLQRLEGSKDPSEGVRVLEDIVSRMKERMRFITGTSYCDFCEAHPDLDLPRLVLIIDEWTRMFTDTPDAVDEQAIECLRFIKDNCHVCGVSVIFCATNAGAVKLPEDIMTGLFTTRVALKCTDEEFKETMGFSSPRSYPAPYGYIYASISGGEPELYGVPYVRDEEFWAAGDDEKDEPTTILGKILAAFKKK